MEKNFEIYKEMCENPERQEDLQDVYNYIGYSLKELECAYDDMRCAIASFCLLKNNFKKDGFNIDDFSLDIFSDNHAHSILAKIENALDSIGDILDEKEYFSEDE